MKSRAACGKGEKTIGIRENERRKQMSNHTILVNANVEMTTVALEAIVRNAKEIAGRDEKGICRVDTAAKVGEMISRFLQERDFQAYVTDIDNFPR